MKMKVSGILMALVLALSLCLVMAAPVMAATTWYVSTTGDDGGAGNSGDPFLTIGHAIIVASAGDTIIVAAGTYNESVIINVNNLTLSGDASKPQITGGLKFVLGLTGLALENFYVTGSVGPQNTIVRMDGVTTDLSVDNCVFDGEDISGRHGFSGGMLEGNVTVTNCEFKRILGWAVFDTRSGSGGDGSALGTVTFANNYIHHCNGSIVFRGLSTDRTDLVNAYKNRWETIGGNAAETGEHWAALEVDRTIEVNVYKNKVNNVAMGQYGEGQAFQFWDIDTLNVYENDITNNYQGIFIFGGGGIYPVFSVPGGSIYCNSITGNDQYGTSVDPTATGGPLDAARNWWGDASGPYNATANPSGTGDSVSNGVNFTPWLSKPGCESPVVGGEVYPVSKFAVLAPYLVLAAVVIAVVATRRYLRKRNS